MQVTALGVIMALKNLGLWLGSMFLLADIQANPLAFLYALLIYALVSIPSDLYMLNKAHENGKKESVG